MKSAITCLLILAVIVGVSGCKDPVYHAANADPVPEAEVAPSESAPPVEPAVPEVSPRDQILALRAKNLGKTYQDLKINGTPLGDGTIISIDDVGVRLRLPAGFTDFSWSELPDHFKEAWGHDPSVSAMTPEAAANTNVVSADTTGNTAPQPLDPQTAARVLAYKEQIAKLNEKIQNANNVINEAQTFHDELIAVYAIEDKEAAKLKAARVYARMRSSSVSS